MSNPIELALNPPRVSKKRGIRLDVIRRDPAKPFVWPLLALGSREPSVVREHHTDRKGVDLGYEPEHYDRELFAPVYAVNDGEIAVAIESPTGNAVSIDHGTWSTHYTGLSKLIVIPCLPRWRGRERVRRGDVIGYAAKSPIRIGFELWQWTDNKGFVAVDALDHLKSWKHAPASVKEAA